VLQPTESISDAELYAKLMDEIDWQTRNLWKEEYLRVVRLGLRVYSLAVANASFGDPRIVVQHALSADNLPKWMTQRALRFVFVVRRAKWTEEEPSSRTRIDVLAVSAKLASSFVKVYCAVLNVSIQVIDEEAGASSERIDMLLHEPHECGTVNLPVDQLRAAKLADPAVLCIDSLQGVDAEKQGCLVGAEKETCTQNEPEPPTIASPLCGWKAGAAVVSAECVWKDPRECCLCRLCGDDEAGLEYVGDPDSTPETARLGRLLPMSDGLFVHTGCALWSSEVWEDSTDGLVHDMGKARSRGSQLKCFGCGRHGATVGCNKSNCLFNYHYPCAKACGAVFTSSQQVFCEQHKSSATTGVLDRENFEHMKALMIASGNDNDSPNAVETDVCSRIGSLVVHSTGQIDSKNDGFHSENYITPPGYVASRIFWSCVHPRKRTVYVLKVERSGSGEALFTILPGDDPSAKITGPSVAQVYNSLVEKVRKVNTKGYSHGNLLSKLPVIRKSRRKTFGLNGPQVRSNRWNCCRVVALSHTSLAVLWVWTESYP
jgi:hypothetical protein